ncbi:hypothetical protein K438DRAFT_1765345 [Mycena galopus ATCC 62051]|nr:hypothetical protein K438DRAFT_1765345 [Mycena galopus ATCC 62051]
MFKILPLLLLACVLASSIGREFLDFRSDSAAASDGARADPLKRQCLLCSYHTTLTEKGDQIEGGSGSDTEDSRSCYSARKHLPICGEGYVSAGETFSSEVGNEKLMLNVSECQFLSTQRSPGVNAIVRAYEGDRGDEGWVRTFAEPNVGPDKLVVIALPWMVLLNAAVSAAIERIIQYGFHSSFLKALSSNDLPRTSKIYKELKAFSRSLKISEDLERSELLEGTFGYSTIFNKYKEHLKVQLSVGLGSNLVIPSGGVLGSWYSVTILLIWAESCVKKRTTQH